MKFKKLDSYNKQLYKECGGIHVEPRPLNDPEVQLLNVQGTVSLMDIYVVKGSWTKEVQFMGKLKDFLKNPDTEKLLNPVRLNVQETPFRNATLLKLSNASCYAVNPVQLEALVAEHHDLWDWDLVQDWVKNKVQIALASALWLAKPGCVYELPVDKHHTTEPLTADHPTLCGAKLIPFTK